MLRVSKADLDKPSKSPRRRHQSHRSSVAISFTISVGINATMKLLLIPESCKLAVIIYKSISDDEYKTLHYFHSRGLLDGVRRSPSCSNLDLTGQGTSTKKESSTDAAESDAGEKHPKKKSSQQHQQKQRAKNPPQQQQQQQRSRQPVAKQSDMDSATPSLGNKKPSGTISPESVKREFFKKWHFMLLRFK